MDFSLYYRKPNNGELFNTLENSSIALSNCQNYIPLYEKFFSLNTSNYNSINLNHKYYLYDIKESHNKNVHTAMLSDNSNNMCKKTIFCKFSPLLDPLRYMTGSYDTSGNKLFTLPTYNDPAFYPKLADVNNSAYTDGFFTYLSSQLNHHYGFIHGLDYYGSFLGNQAEFAYNIADDIDYLNESEYFHQHKNKLFKIQEDLYSDMFNIDSRRNKTKIFIDDVVSPNQTDTFILDNIEDISFDVLPICDENTNTNIILDLSEVCIFNTVLAKSNRSESSSSCSSHSSNTTYSDIHNEEDDGDKDGDRVNSNGDKGDGDKGDGDNGHGDKDGNGDKDDGDKDDGDKDDDDSSDDDSSDESIDENIECSIYNFPVEMICLEKCENTLDLLMEEDLLNNNEWTSCLFQIIMILTLYQKTFSFTHNDLHTNNIMYIPTEKKFIYYCYAGVYYKVPTYGKIYKLIDFGRSIYKFNGKIMCSDSFRPKGDAASQYNCDPYFDVNKPRLEPNYSFDLCRLACCLFDHFVEDLDDISLLTKKNKIVDILYKWLLDDKGRNILYKNNGEERYPEFKLYKMIARTIHNAIPSEQITHELFETYITSKKKINKNQKILNFDKIPTMQ